MANGKRFTRHEKYVFSIKNRVAVILHKLGFSFYSISFILGREKRNVIRQIMRDKNRYGLFDLKMGKITLGGFKKNQIDDTADNPH
jgi:hypothetical protein